MFHRLFRGRKIRRKKKNNKESLMAGKEKMKKYVYVFTSKRTEGDSSMKQLLGGKG